MKLRTIVKPLAALTFMAVAAHGHADNYFGGNVAFVDYGVDGFSGDASLSAVYGRVGTELNEYVSGELRAGLGIGDDSISGVDVEIDNLFGAYARAGIPNDSAFFPYAIAGYTRGEVEASGFGASSSDSESDFSFGVGVDVDLGNVWKLNVEYMNYLDKDGAEIDGFSVGFVTTF